MFQADALSGFTQVRQGPIRTIDLFYSMIKYGTKYLKNTKYKMFTFTILKYTS